MKASVIIRTRNEAQYLARCLRAVTLQQGVSPEIIIVDNESNDDTLAFVPKPMACLDRKLKFWRSDDKVHRGWPAMQFANSHLRARPQFPA